jgi:hypothetical protein
MFFLKKNNQNVELFNKLNNLENKIDTLDNKFESVTFMDGCCDCRKRENKIYTDLQEYLDSKLLEIKNSLLDSINKNITHQHDSSGSDSSSDSFCLENLELKLKIVIEDVYNKNRSELLSALNKCCETHTNTNKTDINNLFTNLTQNLTSILGQLQIDMKSNYNEKDISLRTDLHKFLLGLQGELSTNISSQTSSYINHVLDINNQLTKHIKDLESLSMNIDKNVSGFYYENEVIKHQLQLSEDIRRYSDEIETLRLLANNAKTSIDNVLDNFELDE